MNETTRELLKIVSDMDGEPGPNVAYNIREDSGCAGRQSSEHIKITPKKDKPGIDITIAAGTKSENVYIPACVTHSAVSDVAYNDFFIGDGAEVTIVAGCGVHSDGHEDAQHNGIHRFFIGKNARVVYLEKHIGTGKGAGKRIINPETYVEMDENSYMEMNTTQIGGVDSTKRDTGAKLAANAKMVIRERLLTDGEQEAETKFTVEMNGEDSSIDLISRSVARGYSKQILYSNIAGNAKCSGHSECDAIIMDHGTVNAIPGLLANHIDAALIHEAAIGKIAGEQILKLKTLGLTEKEAEEKIVNGFLK
ncbi:MAG: SufD family Fe-S cluster assembly protein [Lachnospiraceae bacterium]|nr:SufD family Fe-S cluster assembly protein [Lachnospiraceae bacterium]